MWYFKPYSERHEATCMRCGLLGELRVHGLAAGKIAVGLTYHCS